MPCVYKTVKDAQLRLKMGSIPKNIEILLATAGLNDILIIIFSLYIPYQISAPEYRT